MKEPCRHGCGCTLNELRIQIRGAVYRCILRNTDPEYQRGWYAREVDNKKFHPAVVQALDAAHPKDLHQLVLEHPHISSDGRLGYTQNDEKGFKDIQTVTTVGRYLVRHFPSLPSHEIRGLAQLKTGCRIVLTMDEMQRAVMTGPYSCMQWSSPDNPYQSYCPSLGWGMAINEECDDIVGRALVHIPSMTFVRTYAKIPGARGAASCSLLQHWLGEQGYTHSDDWPDGTKIKNISGRSPYLDGSEHRADADGKFWVIDTEGEYLLDCTDGTYNRVDGDDDDEEESIGSCNECDDSLYDGGDHYYVRQHEDTMVCGSCFHHRYQEVIGSGGRTYFIHEDHVTEVGNKSYDEDFIYEQEDVCTLHNGSYADIDDCFYCNVAEEYYECERENMVELADGRQAAERNAWQCSVSGEWYSNNEKYVEINGDKVHPDNVEIEDPEDFELTPSPIELTVPEPEVETPPSKDELNRHHSYMSTLLSTMQPERIYELA